MFSHSRASTAANTRILHTFTLTGDEQGILGGFFRVIVNAIEIHGGDHLLVQTEAPGTILQLPIFGIVYYNLYATTPLQMTFYYRLLPWFHI